MPRPRSDGIFLFVGMTVQKYRGHVLESPGLEVIQSIWSYIYRDIYQKDKNAFRNVHVLSQYIKYVSYHSNNGYRFTYSFYCNKNKQKLKYFTINFSIDVSGYFCNHLRYLKEYVKIGMEDSFLIKSH